jgi:transcriptional regulator with XRE-family HTH domain
MGAERRDDAQQRQLGEYIRLQRQLADLSLRRMAELTDVSNAYLSQVERGLHQPSLRVLRSIAAALNVSADTMLAQAGLIDGVQPTERPDARSGTSGSDNPVRVDTETAIANDPDLSAEERAALLAVYRNFRQRHSD